MRAKDIMTTPVLTVAEDTPVTAAAKLLLEHHISAVPVVTADDEIIGIVSEGDFMRRAEGDDLQHRSWWLRLISDPSLDASDYVKTHSRLVRDVMTKDVITANEDMSIPELAHLLEAERIKRAPVIRGDKLVGIVSRADILRSLTARRKGATATTSATDEDIRAKVLEEIKQAAWSPTYGVSVFVEDGVVQLWGIVDTQKQRDAMRVLAQNVSGVKDVELHLGSIPARAWAQ